MAWKAEEGGLARVGKSLTCSFDKHTYANESPSRNSKLRAIDKQTNESS